MFKSIQTKTMFFLVAFAICFLVVAGYLMVYGTEKVTHEIKEKSLRDEAELLSNILVLSIGEENSDPATFARKTDDLKQLLDSEGITGDCFLINNKKETFGCDDKEKPYSLNFDGDSEVQDIYKNKMHYVSAVARLQGHTGWYVVLEEKESEAYDNLNFLKTITIAVIIILLFFLWALGKRISFAIQKPIKALADSALMIADGDISHGLETKETGELADIAESFNAMLYKLKSTMQQVLEKSGESASMQEIMEYVEETYDNLPGGILSINNLGEITTFNKVAETLTGIDADELIGINVENPTPPGIRNLLDPLRRCLSRGSLRLKKLTDIKTVEGETVPVVYSINIQFDVNDEVIGAICVFRRIADIKRFEESANRVKNLESLGEMAASLAHEIRNPLTSIRGYAQYMKAELDEQGPEELDIILYEVDRLNHMLNRFLTFARPKLPELKEENMNELMKYVMNLVKQDMPDNIVFKTDFGDIPAVMLDKEMFEPLLLNLMLNAVQALPDGGEIKLITQYDRKRKMVKTIVQDNGIGIPSEISDKIFDPFFTTKADGTGMGLAIAARTVEAHNGVMEAESLEGEMTRFTIMLQAVIEDDTE